jgi:hypothetical protein
MEHVSALEATSKAGAVRSRRTRVSTGPLLYGEAGLESLARGSTGALLGRGEGFRALDTWQRWSTP